MQIKSIIGYILLVGASACALVAQGAVVNFENVPVAECYQYGDTNLGDYYSSLGVHFGPDVTILDRSRGGYNTQDYPARSGSAVAFSAKVEDIVLKFDFPVDNVSFWYSARNGTLVDALLKDGSTERLYFKPCLGYLAQAIIPDSKVTKLTIRETPGYFTMDNVSFDPSPVPEPSALFFIPGFLVAALGIARNRGRISRPRE